VTSPRRRPLRLDDLNVETTLKRAAAAAPEVELGWSVIRQDMRDAGWPTRLPDDDRRVTLGDIEEPPCIDYADPSGDLAARLDNLARDNQALRDHWQQACGHLRAMAAIARRHLPPGPPAVPACSLSTCDEHVEMTAGGGYRGMRQIAGMWVAKPGVRPVCARHRSDGRREGAGAA
jgi:hypothetical protein